jgi:hypothetical protein
LSFGLARETPQFDPATTCYSTLSAGLNGTIYIFRIAELPPKHR